MPEASIACPICGLADSIGFYEGVENGAPHGAGYWPMQVSEMSQNCDCDISEAQITELGNKAWKPFQEADDAYAAELAALYADGTS